MSNIYVLDNKLYKSISRTSRFTGYKDFQNKMCHLTDVGILLPDESLTYPDNQIIEMYPYFPESDLFDIIYSKKNLCSKLEIIKSILQSIKSIHQNYFAHRDIKLENMLFLSDIKYTYLIDMVMSCKYNDRNPFYGGTTQYASPELLNRITILDWRQSDIWALGIVIYIIMFDLFPWVEADIIRCSLYKKYTEDPESYWNSYQDLDPKIKKLLEGCLVINPLKRLNIYQLLDIINN